MLKVAISSFPVKGQLGMLFTSELRFKSLVILTNGESSSLREEEVASILSSRVDLPSLGSFTEDSSILNSLFHNSLSSSSRFTGLGSRFVMVVWWSMSQSSQLMNSLKRSNSGGLVKEHSRIYR